MAVSLIPAFHDYDIYESHSGSDTLERRHLGTFFGRKRFRWSSFWEFPWQMERDGREI